MFSSSIATNSANNMSLLYFKSLSEGFEKMTDTSEALVVFAENVKKT